MIENSSIEEINKWAGGALPGYYLEFLASHVEGIVGDLVLIYGTDSLIERNETHETREYCPGYLAIGDDSGGRVFLIAREAKFTVYLSQMGSMDPHDFKSVSHNFRDWVATGCPLNSAS